MPPRKSASPAATATCATRLRLFLGAASENDPFLQALESALENVVTIDSWRSVMSPGVHTLTALRRAAATVDCAAFVWGTDDRTKSRRKTSPSPRDNVVYEAGLFAGYLGFDRTFVINAPDTKFPTDYQGVTTIPKTNPADVADRLAGAMAKLGPVPASQIAGDWWQLVTSGDLSSSVMSFLQIARRSDTGLIKVDGLSMDKEGRCVGRWSCPAAALDDSMTLHYSWEGTHQKKATVPQYFGSGEIRFQREPFVGKFSSTPRDLARETRIREARYLRADP